jgi:LysR family transcriptional regulator, regulator of gene expression of beta-lactamase
MFARQLSAGLIAQPFEVYTSKGSYWLTSLKSKIETPAMRVFREWIAMLSAGAG